MASVFYGEKCLKKKRLKNRKIKLFEQVSDKKDRQRKQICQHNKEGR